jgi:hypothetical protein
MAAALEQAQYSTIMEITGTEAAADQLDAWLRLNDPEAREAIRSAANGRSPGHTRVLVSNAWKNFKQATATHR